MARLGDICEILNGYAFKSEKYISSGIRIIRIANVQKGYIEDTAPAFYPIDTPDIEKYTLYEDDLLISLTGNVGRVALLKKEFLPAALNQRVACLRLKNGVPYDKSFLYCFLNSDYFENKCIQSAKGVAQKNMSTEWLKEYEIPDFSLVEQREIATILNKVSELIVARTQQLSTFDDIVKSRFIELFGDPVLNSKNFITKKGIDLFKISNGKAVPNDKRFESGIPAYGGNGISWYTDDVLYDKDTIVIGRVGFQSGNVHLVNGPVWITDNAMYISEFYDDSLSLVFLCELMEQIDFTKQQDAGDLKKVTQKPFMEMEYILPPKKLQYDYMAFVEQTDKLKFEVKEALEKLETLKKSLMQQYFG